MNSLPLSLARSPMEPCPATTSITNCATGSASRVRNALPQTYAEKWSTMRNSQRSLVTTSTGSSVKSMITRSSGLVE